MTPFASIVETQIQRTEDLRNRASLERELAETRHALGVRAGLARTLRAIACRLDPESAAARAV